MKIVKMNLKDNMAAVYIRVSTDNRAQDESYEMQYEMLEREIKKHGYEIYKVYKERITATKTDGRAEFNKMLEEAQKHKFSAIFAKDLSRLARNQEVAHRFKRIALENDINVFTIGEGENIEQDSLMFGIKSLTNEHYSADLSKKIKMSFKNKALRGEYTRPEAPYGYFVKDKKLFVRNDNTPDVVRKIFRLYLEEGHGVDHIAKRLNEQGIKPPALLKKKSNAGIYWHGTSVKYILTNRAYVGDLVQNREETISIYTKKRKKNDEPIVVENTHEAIIPRNVFEQTQRLMKKRSSGPRPTPKKHLFTDILICGKCGKNYWYRSAGNRYICGAYARHGKRVCSANAVKEDELVDIIKSELQEFMKNYTIDNALEEEVDNKLKTKIYSIEKEKEVLTFKLEKLEESRGELILSKVMKEITEAEYAASTKVLEKKIDKIKGRLEELKNINLEIDEMQVQKKIKNMFLGIGNIDNITREIVDKFIDKIIVHDKDNLEIFYKFKM